MLSNTIGRMQGLEMLFQEQLLRYLLQQEQGLEEKKPIIVRGVSWLCESLSRPKADPSKAPPEVGDWTCPRCRSHRCMRVNPGKIGDPVYCCAVCGYRFHKASASPLPAPSG